MPRLVWDAIGEHFYETGVDHGVLYLRDDTGAYNNGVVWNGLTAVSESPSGAEPTPLWADNIKYLNLISAEEFGATIEAYTYPKEFALANGEAELLPGVYIGQQPRISFGFVYRTVMGNDVALNNYGYKLHLIYGATVTPSEKSYATINDSPEAITFSWEMTTVPAPVTGKQPTASLTIDSTKFTTAEQKEALAALEAILFGSEQPDQVARLPLPDEVATILAPVAG